MTQALSESFCERCGTRYQFENPRAKSGALAGVRVLGKGLRKLALTRASSLDEALETARSDDERAANNRELEEFHGTFHFCLSCRQYTCLACWNPAAGVCLTCAPTAESEAATALEALRAAMASEQATTSAPLATAPRIDEWGRPIAGPAVDEWGRPIGAATEAAASGPTTTHPPDADDAPQVAVPSHGTPSWSTEPPATPDADRATSAPPAEVDEDAPLPSFLTPLVRPEPRPIPADVIEAEPQIVEAPNMAASSAGDDATGAASDWLQPGTSLDDAIAAYEETLRREAQPEPEPIVVVAAAEPEPEPIVVVAAAEPEPEPIVVVAAAEPEPEPEPGHLPFVAVPRPRPEPIAETLRPAAQFELTNDDRLSDASRFAEDPRFAAWSIRAPDAPAPVIGPTPAEAVRSAAIAVGTSTLGAASVATAPRTAPATSAHACISCGLSLSANARFCRRCGSRQG